MVLGWLKNSKIPGTGKHTLHCNLTHLSRRIFGYCWWCKPGCSWTLPTDHSKAKCRVTREVSWHCKLGEARFRNTAQQVWGYTFKKLHNPILNLKFSSTVQTSLVVFFKWYHSKTMRTLMQFSCGGQHASKAHLSLIKLTKWSLGKAYLYYCINFHSFLPS